MKISETPAKPMQINKALVEKCLQEELLPIWRGQVSDWSAGVVWLRDKSGWTPETIRSTILLYLREWNRQKDIGSQRQIHGRAAESQAFFPTSNL